MINFARSLVITAAAIAAGSALAAPSNLFDEFSLTSNPNEVWTYGYASAPGGTFTAFTTVANPADGLSSHSGLVGWTVGNVPAIAINTRSETIFDGNVDLPTGEVLLHGAGFNPQAAEVIWRAPSSGSYLIDAVFTGRQINMKANIAVLSGVSTIFSTFIAGDGASASFQSAVRLSAGDLLTFAVNRDGADPNGFSGNWVGLDLTVGPVPEPATAALMALGITLLAARSIRGRAEV